MPAAVFEKHIHELNFSFISQKGTSGVLLTANYENTPNSIASPDIIFALETACKFDADAVYFRYFEDGRSSVPQLYIFDYTHKSLSTEDRNRIHKNMWNGYQVPAYIIVEQSAVSVFDSREKPKEDKEHYAAEIIKKTGDAIKSFNAQSFNDGLFWEEDINKKRFQFEQSATRDLIRGLKNVFQGFQKESNLDKHVALKLLVQSLLIKYLEERDEDSKSGYFAGTYFKNNFQCADFCDVIRKGKLLLLLDKLAEDFNGKIFEWNLENEAEARKSIQKSQVTKLADYLDGNNDNGQLVIWRLYSFSHLPVEVISSVYEELLTDSKDIVYTPDMIVSTLVDECMPLKFPEKEFKLIDVSCGSGIFLVKAYKRIVQWWRYEQWQKTGKLEKPSLSILKNLLLKSIYGIDIQQDAIRLSIFSLALAILDEVNLDPPTWEKLKFPDMSNNIITKDFFEFITEAPKNDFSLVIGNPPFNLAEINGKEPSRKQYFKELNKTIKYKSDISIPDENPALHFLVQSMRLLKSDGILSMIQPSVPILYQKDKIFRQELFSMYNLLQVLDFTKLSDKLWSGKNVPTAAIFMQKSAPDFEDVLHLVANRTFSNINRLFLEFDHYDFHFISKEDIFENLFIWKANLLGGGRIKSLLQRFSNIRTLGQFIESKKNDGWVKGEGFIENKNGKAVDYITGKKFLPASALQENKINFNEIHPCEVNNFLRPRNKLIYCAPHLLIRANIGESKLIAHLSDEYLVFRNKIIGIYAPPKDRSILVEIETYFNEFGQLLRFIIFATSSQIKVSRHSVPMTEDFMDLPFPEDLKLLKTSQVENIIIEDLLKYQFSKTDSEKLGENNHFNTFSLIFCKTLNSIYQTDHKHFQLYKIIDAGKYIAMQFEYSENTLNKTEEQVIDLEQYINETIPHRNIDKQQIHIQKIMKVYGQDCIILVKPKQLRYWLASIALRDADEVFADYVKARYQDA